MEELQKWINENPINAARVAEHLGLSRAAFNNKLKGLQRNRFTPDQIDKLRDLAKQVKENTSNLEKALKKK